MEQRPSSIINPHSNYKVSYLNKPSTILQTTSSATSFINHAAAEGGIILAINQDSKLSFKEYMEMH